MQPASAREQTTWHADIVGLQRQLDISYKDAGHRLYMAEVEKVKVSKLAAGLFRDLRERVDAILLDGPNAPGVTDYTASN